MPSVHALHWKVPVAVLCDGGMIALPRAGPAQFIAAVFRDAWTAGALLMPYPAIVRVAIPVETRRRVIERSLAQVDPALPPQPVCTYCARVPARLTIDHIVPVSFGGTNHVSNLQVACGGCNTAHYRETFARVRQRSFARLVDGVWTWGVCGG
jgi:hypothetical protein